MEKEPLTAYKNTKRVKSVLFLSGLFVAISYVVLLIPFAIYSLAQVAAMTGKRYSLLVMFLVFVTLALLSLLIGSSVLFSSALLVFLSMPFCMSAIYLREKNWSKTLGLVILLCPFLFCFSSLSFLPVMNEGQYNAHISQLKKQFNDKKIEIQGKVASSVSAAPQAQILAKYDEAIDQVEKLGDMTELKYFMSSTPWQRVTWFVFGPSSLLTFFALLLSFANLIFLDLAYEQVEKIKAIINYVLKNISGFSYEFVLTLSQMPFLEKGKTPNSISIVKHESQKLGLSSDPNVKIIKLSLIKAKKTANKINLRGYSFTYEGTISSWNLKSFSLPLPLALFSIVYMAILLFWFGGTNEIVASLANNHYAMVIALCSIISFAILAILTLQGLLTFYSRVSNFIGLILLFGLFILVSSFSIGYYAILTTFSSIALLDYVYDWRGRNTR